MTSIPAAIAIGILKISEQSRRTCASFSTQDKKLMGTRSELDNGSVFRVVDLMQLVRCVGVSLTKVAGILRA